MSADLTFNWTFLLLPLLGFVVSLFVTMLGGGGGIFYVPALTLLFNIPTQLAVATSLASIIPTTILGSISHRQEGSLDLFMGMIFGTGGMIGALIGAYVANLLSSILLGKLFGVFMIILGISMVFSTRKRTEKRMQVAQILPSFTWSRGAVGLIFGISSGMMAGLFGISGTPPVIAGLYILGFPAAVVVGTSVFVLLFNAVSGLLGHLMLGQFDLMLILLLGCGAAVGAFVGPKFLSKVKSSTLERVYGPLFISMVIMLGIIMIFE